MSRSPDFAVSSPLTFEPAIGLLFDEQDDAALVHELKTPLASLLGYARIVRLGWDRMSEERRNECFDVVERQGRRLTTMLEALLTARTMAVAPAVRVPVDLRRVIDASVETAQGLGGRHSFEVRMPDGDLGLFGDEQGFEHIVTNLLDNAVKYSPEGSVIHVAVDEQPGEVVVRVENEGDGVPAADLPFIFDRFRRASKTPGGSGLGLAIVRRLAAAHGGRVHLESTPYGTTVATVILPRRCVSDRSPE